MFPALNLSSQVVLWLKQKSSFKRVSLHSCAHRVKHLGEKGVEFHLWQA